MVGPTMRLKLLVGGLALSLGAPLPPQQQALDPSSAQADGSQVKPAEGAMPQVLRGVPHWDSTLPPDPWGAATAGCSFGCLRARYGFSRPLLTKNSFTGRSRAADTFA